MPPDNLAEAAAIANEALPLAENIPEPVSIELPPEEAVTPEPAPPPKPAAKPEDQRNRSQERITGLVSDKNALIQELETERRRSADLAASLQAKEQELSIGQLRQMELHKARLVSEAEKARNDYETAFNSQDARKQADATARLARSESGLADVEAWEARNKAAPQQPQQAQPQPQQQQRQQPAPPKIDAGTASWMEDNPWFSPQIDGRQNAEFDRAMHLTAVAYASRLEDRYRAESRTQEIGTPEYWAAIDEYMAREFPDRYDVQDDGNAPAAQAAKPAPSPVAPATRSQPHIPGAKSAPSSGGRNVLAQLSGQERAMADSLRNSGALVYPKNHPKVQANPKLQGERMTPEDSYIAYGTQIRRDKADQAQRRANQ